MVRSAEAVVAGTPTLLPLKRKGLSPSPTLLPPSAVSTSAAEYHKVVWPPVVIIENTLTHLDPTTRLWKGLENAEIHSFLRGVKDLQHSRVKALYDAHGNHKGRSLVIFPASALGFMDAQALCEYLERDDRGNSHWLKNRALQQHMTKNGKKILYGYLASERDMQTIDHKRKTVKLWKMESYEEKVLAPLKRIESEREEARKKRVELVEEKEKLLVSLEHKKVEVDKAASEFQKINAEIREHKRQEEELEARHKKNLQERKREHEREKLAKDDEFRTREMEIREHLRMNKIAREKDMVQYEVTAQHLKDGIDEEKRKHKVRLDEQKRMEVMDLLKVDSMLQAKMEERLSTLERKFQEKQLNLQLEHNQQIRELRKENNEKREVVLEGQIEKLKGIEKEVKDAKATSQRVQEERLECAVCLLEFGKEVSERALLKACGHANLCPGCADKIWKVARSERKNPLCPTCNTEQEEEWGDLPARIYS